jgi:hypothetical protein
MIAIKFIHTTLHCDLMYHEILSYTLVCLHMEKVEKRWLVVANTPRSSNYCC